LATRSQLRILMANKFHSISQEAVFQQNVISMRPLNGDAILFAPDIVCSIWGLSV
jgi:hypothetical protein